MQLTTRPKLAFFDIDGTLIGKSGVLSDRSIEAVRSLQRAGVAIAIASGRPMFGALQVCQQLEIDSWSMFSSGALLGNPKDKKVLFEASIERSELEDCINTARSLGLYTELYSKDNYFIEKESGLTQMHSDYLGLMPTRADFDQVICNYPINKVVTISDSAKLHQQQQVLTEKISKLICLSSKGGSHPEIIFNNITSSAAGRREGFFKLIAEANVKAEETIAFGDAKSDIVFLELAGLGVAMKDAPDEVKESANLVADKADNDGVAKIIEQILREID